MFYFIVAIVFSIVRPERFLAKTADIKRFSFAVRALWHTSHPDLTQTFLLQHSISYLRIVKLEFYFMKKCSCQESNSRLLIESTVSYPLDHQDNDTGKCNFLVIIFLKNDAITLCIYNCIIIT